MPAARAGGDAAHPTSKAAPAWAVEITAQSAKTASPAHLERLRNAGISLVVHVPTGKPSVDAAVASAVRRARLKLIRPSAPPRSAAQRRALTSACRASRVFVNRCAVVAGSAREANGWVQRGTVDWVVLRLKDPAAVARLTPKAGSRARLVAIVDLKAGSAIGDPWRQAVDAGRRGGVVLGVAPTSTAPEGSLDSYLQLLSTGRTTAGVTDVTPPTQPTGLALTGNGLNFVSLAWTPSTDDSRIVRYDLFVNGALAGVSDTSAATLSGLACFTRYTIGVEARDEAGNRSARSLITAETYWCLGGGGGAGGGATPSPPPPAPVPDTTPPTAPAGISQSSVTATSVVLNWTPSTDAVGVAGYGVYRGGALVGSAATATYLLTGLTCATSTTVQVDAFDAAGNRSARTAFAATTSACAAPDTVPPTVPGGLAATGATATSISLSWSASTDAVGVAGYGVYRNGTLVGSPTARTYTVSGLACGTTYTLSVDAYDAAGNRSPTASVASATGACPDTTAPTVPTALVQTLATSSSVTVSWGASSDDVGVTGYGRYRDGVLVSTGAGTSFTFSGLACGTSYLIGVDAVDAAGNRSGRATVSASTSVCPAPTPTTGTANLWVDLSGGSCVRSASLAGYVDAQACGSLNAAYQAAAAGDRILVKGGSYGAQNINNRTNLAVGSSAVVFQPAPGETATFFDVTIWTHDLIFEGGGTIGLEEPNRFVFQDSADVQMAAYNSGDRYVTLEDVKAESTFVQADKVDIRYSDFGPLNICTDENGTDDNVKLWWWSVNGSDRGSRNITFEYNLVHENIDSGCSGGNPHNDAIQMELDDSVIRGNRIWHCGTQCIFQGYDSRNVIIENNMVEETDACPRCGIATEVGVAGTVTLRNNTIEGNVTFSGGTIPANATVTGNIFLTGIGCDPAATYRNNIFPAGGSTCGTGARRGTPTLNNGAAYTGDRQADWHLHPTDTTAHNNGDPTSIPTHDIDGQTRPQGTIDAGADEIN